jgi:hypothetical protein
MSATQPPVCATTLSVTASNAAIPNAAAMNAAHPVDRSVSMPPARADTDTTGEGDR